MRSSICKIVLAFVITSTTSLVFAKSKPQKFAVLVATTKNWPYYRHQSTVLHAYHTLLSNGMPKENIITMFYDDIANHPKNPEPGIIRNHPLGPNLYTKNVTKFYTGNKVNAKNFIAVLTGNDAVAPGPVIKSGPNDTIFVYICGIGAYRAITFPSGPALPADSFVHALEKIRSEGKAKKIFVMLDVAFAASLVHGLVPRHNKIFVNTATHFKEFPSAVYCDSYSLKRICYATLYGAAWIQRSDRLRKMKFGGRETLFSQFNAVRTQTVSTHVGMYGEIEMGQSRLKEFLEYTPERKLGVGNYTSSPLISLLLQMEKREEEGVDTTEQLRDEQYISLLDYFDDEEGNLDLMKSIEGSGSLNIMSEEDILAASAQEPNGTNVMVKRKFIEDTMKRILRKLQIDFHSIKEPSTVLPTEVVDDYEKSIEAFSSICIDLNENVYALRFLIKLAKICEMRIPLEEQYAAMRSVCTEEHRQMTHAE